MIGKNLQDNLDIKVNSKKMEKLKDDFPEFFTKEGDFKLDSFKDFLKEEEVELTKEAYELNFLGKSYAKYESSLNTETYISPDIEHNKKPENKDSENVYIVGDNIDALKHLLGSYSGKIKCIYIDPQYNTGSDGFVYPDNFKFTKDELADKIGITEEADRILNLEGKSSHATWLTFMYPRLLLARNLLSDDGVIFISIDDNEQANLKKVCDEIFGEINFVAQIIWERAFAHVNLKKHFSECHDYIICYAKNIEITANNGLNRSKNADDRYKNPDNDIRGPWQSDNFSVGPAIESNIYEIIAPSGRICLPPNGRSWRVSEEKFKVMLKNNEVWFDPDGNGVPRQKRFLSNVKAGITPMTIWKYIDLEQFQVGQGKN